MFDQDLEALEKSILAGPNPAQDDIESLIDEASTTHGVPKELIRSIIHVESGGRANAQSGAGAQGLMQLMPPTAKMLGVKNPLDPRENVMGGTKYLAQLMKQFGGDVPKVLQAYNQGPTAVRQGRPMPTETKHYVTRVQARHQEELEKSILSAPGMPAHTEEEIAQEISQPQKTITDYAMEGSEALGHAISWPKRTLDTATEAATALALGEQNKFNWTDLVDYSNVLNLPHHMIGYGLKKLGLDEKLKQTVPGAAVDELRNVAREFQADPALLAMPQSQLLAAAFVPSMLKGTVQGWEKYGEESVKRGWSPEAARALVQAMTSSEMLAMAGHGAKGKPAPKAPDAHVAAWEKFQRQQGLRKPGPMQGAVNPKAEAKAKLEAERKSAQETRILEAFQRKLVQAQKSAERISTREAAKEEKRAKSLEANQLAADDKLKLQLDVIAEQLEKEPTPNKGALLRGEGFRGAGTGDVIGRVGQTGSSVKAMFNLENIDAAPKRLAAIIRRGDTRNPIFQEVVRKVAEQLEDYSGQIAEMTKRDNAREAEIDRLAAADAAEDVSFDTEALEKEILAAKPPKGGTEIGGEIFPGAKKIGEKLSEMVTEDLKLFKGRRGGLGTRPSLEPTEAEAPPLPEYKAPAGTGTLPEGMKAVPDLRAGSKEAQAALEETNRERASMGMPPTQPLSAMRPFEAPRTKYEQQVNEYAAKARAQGLTSFTDILAMVNEARGRHGSRSGKMAQDILDYMKKAHGGSTLLGEVFPGAKAASDWIQGGLDELVRGTRMNKIGLYSKMDEVLDRIPQKMTAPELEKWLLKQGVKKEELRARSFDRLKELDRAYSKTGGSRTPDEWRAQLRGEGEDPGMGGAPEVREIAYGEPDPNTLAARRRLEQVRGQIHEEGANDQLLGEAWDLENSILSFPDTSLPRYAREGLVTPGAKEGSHRERLLQVGESGMGMPFTPKGPAIPHFSNERGIVGWSRTAEHEGPNGERDLHVNEIQSDMANALARQRGAADTASKRELGEGMPFVSDMSWVDLTAKNILWHAAQGDFDRVTWTGAEEQATRNAGKAHADVYEKLLPGAMKRLTGEKAVWEQSPESPTGPTMQERARAEQLYDDLVRIEKARERIWDAADKRKRAATGARNASADEGDLTPEELKTFTELQEDHAALSEEHDAITKRLRQYDNRQLPEGKHVIRLTPELKDAIKKQGFPLFSELFPGAKKVSDKLSEMLEDDLAAVKGGRITPREQEKRQEGLVKSAETVQWLHGGTIPASLKGLLNRGTAQALLSSRTLTALNNLWNTGVRYSLATVVDGLTAPISKEFRSALKGKVMATPDLWGNLIDSVVGIAGKERPGRRTFDQAELLKEMTAAWLPQSLHDNFWHLLSTEIEMPGGQTRGLNPNEILTRTMTAPNVIGERSSRLFIARAELQPFMDELGVKDFSGLVRKVQENPELQDRASRKLNNAITYALDMTAALPPMPGMVKDIVRLVNKAGLAGMLIPEFGPFPRVMLANLPQQLAEQNLGIFSQRWRNSMYGHAKASKELEAREQALETAKQDLAADPDNPALQQARKSAEAAYATARGKVKEMEAHGLKSKRQLAELAVMGPLVTAIFAVKALRETENDKEWYQIDDVKGYVKDIKGMTGSLALNALVGHYLGKLMKKNSMYAGKEGYVHLRDAWEAATQTRKGPQITDLLGPQEDTPTSSLWEKLEALAFRWGQALTSPYPVEIGKKYGEVQDSRELVDRTYAAGKGAGKAFMQGVRSNWLTSKELPASFSTTTGEARMRPGPFSEYGPLPGRVSEKGRVDQFITRHKNLIDESRFALKPTRYPEYDSAVAKHFADLQQKDARLKYALSATDRPEATQVHMFETEMAKLRQKAMVRAQKELLAKIRAGVKIQLPPGVLRSAREAGEKEKMRRQVPFFFRKQNLPYRDRMKRFEERQLQKLGEEDAADVE